MKQGSIYWRITELQERDLTPAEIVVKKIYEDITDRKGFDNEWDSFDEEIKEEIIESWHNIVLAGG